MRVDVCAEMGASVIQAPGIESARPALQAFGLGLRVSVQAADTAAPASKARLV